MDKKMETTINLEKYAQPRIFVLDIDSFAFSCVAGGWPTCESKEP